MKFTLSKKPVAAATVIAFILFVLLLLSWPMTYVYLTHTTSDASPIGFGKAPFVVALHRNSTVDSLGVSQLPGAVRYETEYVLKRAFFISAIVWLLSYEVVDIYGRRAQRKPTVKSTNRR